MKKCLIIILILSSFYQIVLAGPNLDEGLTPYEKGQVDQMLLPVLKIYNLIKYSASLFGVIMLVFSGITFVVAGGEITKKEKAKSMGSGVVIGLILIWVAPVIVRFIFS